jgi:hypothetical protein
MLYIEIIAACSDSHIGHVNAPCGQNVELCMLLPVVHNVTAML